MLTLNLLKFLTLSVHVTKLIFNIPAMPMTCSQVTHKSSGFFTFYACKSNSLPNITHALCLSCKHTLGRFLFVIGGSCASL
jgi:hypothetical protein